tara:strand:- start:2966 stop:3523 length:558 start_codon:yes stop_codon:yes gene_type:complete
MAEKIKDEVKIKIRDEFVYGFMEGEKRVYPSIDSLVKKHNVSRATLYRLQDKENWQQQKNQIQSEIQAQIDADRIKNLVEESNKLDDRTLLIAQGLIRSVARRMQRSFDQEQENPESNGIPVNDLRELSHVALNAQKIGKLALGQAQEISKVSGDLINPEAFREVLEELDRLAEEKSSTYEHTLQ